jgi:hypothetical protein
VWHQADRLNFSLKQAGLIFLASKRWWLLGGWITLLGSIGVVDPLIGGIVNLQS